jgi:hypothetical protein
MKQNGPVEYDFDNGNISTRGVSHCGLAIYNKVLYLRAKEELWKFKLFIVRNYNLPKNPLKETKTFQDT